MTDFPYQPDAELDAIANRVCEVLQGEGLFDVACVCAKLATFAIVENNDDADERLTEFREIIKFMEFLFEQMTKKETKQ